MPEARIIHGNAFDLPLDDASVDLIVTSPPYFGLRSYTDGGERYEGQVGGEATPGEYLDALIAATRETMRVLKPSGSIWVNLGDKYAQTAEQWQGSRRGHKGAFARTRADIATQFGQSTWNDAPSTGAARPKSLMGVPWRYAIRCIDELGLILRAEVIWSKPNGLPESVTDRVRRSHEQWFHFTTQPHYFSAVDEIREEYESTRDRGPSPRFQPGTGRNDSDVMRAQRSPLGKLPGSVWTVPTQPLIVPPELGIDHFAAFPIEWPLRIIKGWSPSDICTVCGEGLSPVAEVTERKPNDQLSMATRARTSTARGSHVGSTLGYAAQTADRHIVGYACACPEPTASTEPAVVLDPFGGTGTTALAAKVLGRIGISVDLSSDYCRLAEWRVNDPGQIARAVGMPKPAKEAEGQIAFF